MKYLSAYKQKIECVNEEDVFSYIISTLKTTITSWDYFVNWKKVLDNYSKLEHELHLLNSLIGKENIELEAEVLLKKYPSVKKAIPVLLAMREKDFSLLTGYMSGFYYSTFAFSEDMPCDQAVLFMKSSGLLKLFSDKTIKSIPDYVVGVEAGLDSNARKNRTGSMMETIVGFFVEKICKKNGWDFLSQATKKKIFDKWGKSITVEKSDREIDFAILADDNLFLIETNFYSTVGSKLKSTAGEYKSDFRRWTGDGHNFIWITDGAGWKNTSKPLRETYDEIDYIINLDMLERGILENIITCGIKS